MQHKKIIPERRERNRRTKSFLKLHRPVWGEEAIEQDRQMPINRTRAYEWHCFKDESHQWPEERPQTIGFFVAEWKVEFLSDDGKKTAKFVRCCWNGRHFIYTPVFRQKVYRIFWRKARKPFLDEEEA